MDNLSGMKAVLDIIDYFDPPKRSRSMNNAEALKELIYMLKANTHWRAYRPTCGVTWHCLYKRFHKWVKLGILREIKSSLLRSYSKKKLKRTPKWFKTIFIDSTLVKSMYGVECVGRNPVDRAKPGIKVSIICDENMVPIMVCRNKVESIINRSQES